MSFSQANFISSPSFHTSRVGSSPVKCFFTFTFTFICLPGKTHNLRPRGDTPRRAQIKCLVKRPRINCVRFAHELVAKVADAISCSLHGDRCVLSPELQECMDQTKGALLRAHTAEEAAKPPKFWVQSRGRTSATIRCEQSTKGGGAIAEVHENHGGHRRRPVIAHSHTRSLRTLRSSTLKNKTHRPPQQPPGGHPISMVRSPGARTVARTGAMISDIHNLGDYLGEFW